MRHLPLFVVLAVGSLALGAGCRSKSDVAEAHEAQGTTHEYAVAPDEARRAAVEILKAKGAKEVEEHPDHVVASWGVGLTSWGSYLGVWFEPGAKGTRVKAVGKRKLAVQAGTNLSEEDFHTALAAALGGAPVAAR